MFGLCNERNIRFGGLQEKDYGVCNERISVLRALEQMCVCEVKGYRAFAICNENIPVFAMKKVFGKR